MSRPFDELIARANAAGARALEYLGEDWNEVVEAARSALLLQVTSRPPSAPRLSEGEDPSTGRLSAFRTTRRAVEEDATLRQGDRLLPQQQQQALREMALALAEMDPYLCGLPQTHTEGQLAHRSALARDRAIAAMVNYINQISLADLAILQAAHAQLRATSPPGSPPPRTPSPPPQSSPPRLRQNASEEANPSRGGSADLPKSESASSRQVQPKPACGRLQLLTPAAPPPTHGDPGS